MKNFKLVVDQHYWWLSPLLTIIITLSAAFFNYNVEPDMMATHPIRSALIEKLVSVLDEILILSAIILFTLTVINSRNRPTISLLEKQLKEEQDKTEVITSNVNDLFNGYLYQLGKKLDFGKERENTERVTLYIHDKYEKFIPFGRYSPNPMYQSKGRTVYPDKEGCIGKCWQNGWCFDNSFPESVDEIIKKNKDDYGIIQRVSKQFKMLSRLYAAARINDAQGIPLAVIVVESTKQNRFDEADLKKELQAQMNYLSELITKLEQYIPNLKNTNEKGI